VNENEPLQSPYGMFELDAAGIVVHYSPAPGEERAAAAADLVGRNFFDHIFFVTKNEELSEEVKARFFRFMTGDEPVERFTVSGPYGDGITAIHVMIARLTEKTSKGLERLALVRITREARSATSGG